MHGDIVQGILEKWHKCAAGRYRVLLLTLSHKNNLVDPAMDDVADALQGVRLDFYNQFKGNLDLFFTWRQVREQIYDHAMKKTAVVTGLEPFYSKWPAEERLMFLNNLLRGEPGNGILLALFCPENLKEIVAIPENSRGLIWAI